MYCYGDRLPKTDIGGGTLLQVLGRGNEINAVHWNFEDGAVVPLHEHPQEQFGYVIRGAFEMTMGGETTVLRAGDAYFIPPNVPHGFTAIGITEAIDVFTPVRDVAAHYGARAPEAARGEATVAGA